MTFRQRPDVGAPGEFSQSGCGDPGAVPRELFGEGDPLDGLRPLVRPDEERDQFELEELRGW